MPLVGDLRDVLPQLTAALARQGVTRSIDRRLPEWHQQQQQFRHDLVARAGTNVPLHPGAMMAEARKAVPDDAIIVRDGGSTTLFELAYFEQRSQDFMWCSKFAYLGTGLCYAMGAQIAVGPKRRVCLITGDGGFLFHATELETAVRHQLPVVTIVNYDQKWGIEVAPYVNRYGPDGEIDVANAPVRLDKLAESLGGHGEFVERFEDIAPAVERAFASGKPAVVQVATDWRANAYDIPLKEELADWYSRRG